MLKRIEASQARAGMFVEAIEGSWSDTFLIRRRFVLREEDAQKLKKSQVDTIVINTVHGRDVDGAPCSPKSTNGRGTDPAIGDDRNKLDVESARKTLRQSVGVVGDVFGQLRSGGGLEVARLEPVVGEVSESIDRNPAVFISVTRLKSKDETTFLHSISVSALMVHFARYLGMDDATVQILGMGGLLHDIGKLEIPSDILEKNGSLDDREMQIIRAHPLAGHNILKQQGGLHDIILDVCLHHHERVDGKGYPESIRGDQISLHARLAAICDVYDAITSKRSYKAAWRPMEALKWMLDRDGQFDRKLLTKFAICLSLSLEQSAPGARS